LALFAGQIASRLMKRCRRARPLGQYRIVTGGHDALTEALECIKAAGLTRRYSLVWQGRSEAPRSSCTPN
jgi:hypothetical protein